MSMIQIKIDIHSYITVCVTSADDFFFLFLIKINQLYNLYIAFQLYLRI